MNYVLAFTLWLALLVTPIPQGFRSAGAGGGGGSGITAGDLIVCEASFNWNATISGFSDTLNGSLSSLNVAATGTLNRELAVYYFVNSASGSTDVATITYSPTEPNGTMACQAWKEVATFAPNEVATGNPYNPTTTGANASSGNYTTTTNGQLNIGILQTNGVSASSSSGSFVDAVSAENFFPQYFIQGSSSASTQMNYTNSSVLWLMVGGSFKSNGGTIILDGSCHSSTDNGGTSSTTVAVTISC